MTLPITIEQEILPFKDAEEEGLDYENPLQVTIHIDPAQTGGLVYLGDKTYNALDFINLGKIIDRNIV